jgi:ABC-type sugar transport system ATPase subunit
MTDNHATTRTEASVGTTVTAPHGAGRTAIELRQVERSFGSIRALKGVDLRVERGTVHALVGENGAGKSTCLGVIAGRVVRDSGELLIFDQAIQHNTPRRARAAGVVSVYQELTIVPELSAQANVFLGQNLSKNGLTRDRAMRQRYRDLCAELEVACHADEKAGHLSVADQQLLEIMRALVADAQIVLDEPTASLAPHERQVLLRLIGVLRGRGITIVLVSHNLDEVLQTSDRITVFRDGSVARDADRSELTKPDIVHAMLGRALRPLQSLRPAPSHEHELLRIEGLTVPGAIEDISFSIAPGEILGIGGLVGSGRTSVLKALAGATPQATGRLWVEGQERPWPKSPRKARAMGIALIPEDRKSQGLVGVLSAAENIILSDLSQPSSCGFLFGRQIKEAGAAAAEGFGIDKARLQQPASQLSGGNQQKLLLARWAHSRPTVLLADEPTRGIDVGAKAEILNHLQRLADAGLSIVIVSSELEEVVATSSRILVLAEGRRVGFLDNSDGSVDARDLLQTIFDRNERAA